MKKNISSKDIADNISSLWKDKVDKDRKLVFATGRGGAIMQEIAFQELMQKEVLGRELTKMEKAVIEDRVNSKVWEYGIYKTDPKTGLLQYKGLFDKDRSNGIYGVKRNGICYIEYWSAGQRVKYEIITEEEWTELKNNYDNEG